MFKPYIKFILGLLIFVSGNAWGQEEQQLFDTYVKKFTLYNDAFLYTDEKSYNAHHIKDTINIRVKDADEIQQIIGAGLQNKVYGIEIDNKARPDLAKMFGLLRNFSNLTFLEIVDPFGPSSNKEYYTLPENINLLQQLKAINFYFTQQLDMSDAIKKIAALKHLQALAFDYYLLPLPASIADLKNISVVKFSPINIENIDLSKTNWQIVDMADYETSAKAQTNEKALLNLSHINSLRRLELALVYLNDSTTVLSRFKQLNTLSLNGVTLSSKVSLFNELSGLQNLHNLSLHIWEKNFSVDGIQKLQNLHVLAISSLTGLDKLPEGFNAIGQLKNLESLTLTSLGLTSIPDIFTSLSGLKRLSIAGNQISQIPESVFKLPDLEYLDASFNKLTQLPDEQTYACKRLKTLLISNNGLTILPPAITKLYELDNLNVSNNKIGSTPTGWQFLKNLREVNLSVNQLSVFPDGLNEVKSLEKLYINDNKLNHLPDITGGGYQMKYLRLNDNRLTALPEHIGNYAELQYLYLNGNVLADLPESLGMCKKLKELDITSIFRRVSYDMDKPENNRFIFSALDTSRINNNNIKSLPTGLKDAKDLEALNLSRNWSIDSKSVFDVMLSVPRKYFSVNLSYDNISELPANPKWADMTFYNLDISYNKLTTLPVEFAPVKIQLMLNLSHNPLKIVRAIYDRPIQNKGDMKIIYDELGINLQNYPVSNSEYAIALTKRLSDYYNLGKWEKAVEYAQKAITTDSVAYAQNVRWNHIGTCRFKLKDYNGAIKDFDRFIAQETASQFRIMNDLNPVLQYKSEAHLALGQPEKAAQVYEYFSKNFGSTSGLQQAAVIYKSAGNETRYKQLIDSAIVVGKQLIDANSKSRPAPSDMILNYVELLIIAGKPADVIELLAKQPANAYLGTNLSVKNYLTVTANYLINPALFEGLKKSLTSTIAISGKITNWDFAMFNKWLIYSGLSKTKQDELLALETIAK